MPVAATGRWGRSTRARSLDPNQHDAHCAFCARRYLETPPEKARLIRTGNGFATLRHLHAEALFDTVAEFRRVPNLFEIVSFDYWQKNFDYRCPTPSPPTSATIWPRKRVAATSCKSWNNG